MQASKPYSKEHAEALLLPCGEGGRWVIDERGVQPAVMNYKDAERLGLVPEYKLLSWKPVMAFQDDQNAPDCKDTPALPFPFDARDLAAFMLDGVGAFVADYYGDWEDGPETESLNDIDPSNNYARRAVREAFDAYRQAVKSVGEPDNGDTWRDAMVRELLTPKVAPEPSGVEASPVQPQAAAHESVADSADNAPVVKTKAKRRTWWDVSSPYVVEVMRAGQYATCKELYRALEGKAGPDSPFDKGTGANRGRLFVREIARTLDVKTVHNKWATLRELAQK